jgi:tryptophan synthase alpha chain
LQAQVARIRRYTRLPIAVGFGISTPMHAARIAAFADAAVVGSALIDVIERAGRNGRKASQAGAFVARLKRGIKGAKRPVSSF